MKNKIDITIIIPLKVRYTNLEKALNSITQQTIGFKDNINILFLKEDNSDDANMAFAKKIVGKFPHNVKIVSEVKRDCIQTQYIMLFDENICWNKNAFEQIQKLQDGYYEKIGIYVACGKGSFKESGQGEVSYYINEVDFVQENLCQYIFDKNYIDDVLEAYRKRNLLILLETIAGILKSEKQFGKLQSIVLREEFSKKGNKEKWSLEQLTYYSEKIRKIFGNEEYKMHADFLIMHILVKVLEYSEFYITEEKSYKVWIHDQLMEIDDFAISNIKSNGFLKDYFFKMKYGKIFEEKRLYRSKKILFNNLTVFDFEKDDFILNWTNQDKKFTIEIMNPVKEFNIKYYIQDLDGNMHQLLFIGNSKRFVNAFSIPIAIGKQYCCEYNESQFSEKAEIIYVINDLYTGNLKYKGK